MLITLRLTKPHGVVTLWRKMKNNRAREKGGVSSLIPREGASWVPDQKIP